MIRRIRWEDVEDISAIREARKRRSKEKQRPDLMIKISLKLEAISEYKGHHEISFIIRSTDISIVTPKKIVEYMRRFHAVNYQDLYA